MRRAHHLREIDESHRVLIAQDQIELIEIAVDQAMVAQFHNQIHNVVVHLLQVLDVMHL